MFCSGCVTCFVTFLSLAREADFFVCCIIACKNIVLVCLCSSCSFSWCHGLVCGLWLWHFLAIFTFFKPMFDGKRANELHINILRRNNMGLFAQSLYVQVLY